MKLEVGTDVIINDTAPAKRNDVVSFVEYMIHQLGKRGKIIKCEERHKRGTIIQSDEKHNSTYVYQIRTEDGETWWYLPEWFHEASVYTGF